VAARHPRNKEVVLMDISLPNSTVALPPYRIG
jgi:hypothetical protein